MGGANSKRGATGRPFVLDAVQNKNLDMLSAIAARLISLPDIYDLNTVKRPGTCGDYAVFIKDTLTQNLLPFTAEVDLGDGKGVRPVPVLYQSSKQIIKDDKVREKICGSMMDSMLRTVAIVLACLGSMQVASQSRKMAVQPFMAPPKQKGGATSDVFSWLQKNNYIDLPIGVSTATAGQRISLRVTGPVVSRTMKLIMVYNDAGYGAVNTTVYAEDRSPAGQQMPTGGIRMQFLEPMTIVTQRGQSTSMMPVRLLDSTGITWAAGVLHGGYFQSFYNTTPHSYLAPLFEMLFRRTQGWQVVLPETRAAINSANEVFTQLKKNPDPSIILLSISNYLQQIDSGLVPSRDMGVAAGYQPQQRWDYQLPGQYMTGPGPGMPPTVPYRPPYDALGLQPYRGQRQMAGIIGPPTGAYQAVYDSADNAVLKMLKRYRSALGRQSMLSNSPAVVRALTLSASVDPTTRDVQTNICADPYWTQTSLNDVFPWETLQFLCTKDWNSLIRGGSVAAFTPEWEQFLSGLTEIYAGADLPAFVRPAGAVTLDKMRFRGAPTLPACKDGRSPRVAPREIEAGLGSIQTLYTRHVEKMWEVLNGLLSIVTDPQKRVEAVRLNPAVTSSTQSSAKYIEKQATIARQAIVEFYLALEREYVNTIRTMRVAAA